MARKKHKSAAGRALPLKTEQSPQRDRLKAVAGGKSRHKRAGAGRLTGEQGEEKSGGLSGVWQSLKRRLGLNRAERESAAAAAPARAQERTGYVRRHAAGSAGSEGYLARRWAALGETHPRLQSLLRQVATVDGIVAIFLGLLLFYPPYFRGLFFYQELLPTHVYTAMLFALFAFYKIYKKEPIIEQHPLDIAALILLFLYLTSSCNAWSARDALGMLMKMANYTAVYWLLAYSIRTLNGVRGYLGVFAASGAGVALLGLGAAIGTFHYKDAFVGGRIYSSLQYPNTLAAFLTAINLLSLYLAAETRRKAVRVLLGVANYLMFLAFLGAQSRGAMLIYPLALLLLLAGLPGRLRLGALMQLLLQLVSSLAVFGSLMGNAGGRHQPAGWAWLLAGAALAVLLQLAWNALEGQRTKNSGESGRRLKPWVLPVAAVIALALVAGGGYLAASRSTAAGGLAPKDWLQRVRSISLQDDNARERLIMSRDALRIILASPANALLGEGGGGWNATYKQYQDYQYFTTEVHNHFLQVGVETGIPGLLAFIAIWICFFACIFKAVRRYRRSGEDGARGLAWALGIGAAALGAHSLIDFNLSLGAVAIFLWSLFGMGRALERTGRTWPGDRVVEMPQPGWWRTQAFKGCVVGVLAGALFFISLDLAMGQNYAAAADAAIKNQDLDGAIRSLEQAVSHDPWTGAYRTELAQLLLYRLTQQIDTGQLSEAQQQLQEAVRMNRGDGEIRLLYGQALFRSGKFRQGLAQFEQAARLMPFNQQAYNNLAAGYQTAGYYLLSQAGLQQSKSGGLSEDLQKEAANASEYLQKCLQVPARLQSKMAAVPEQHLKLWKGAELEISPLIELKTGEAAALLGRYAEAEKHLLAAEKDRSQQEEARLWRGLVMNRLHQDGSRLVEEAVKNNQQLAKEKAQIEALLK